MFLKELCFTLLCACIHISALPIHESLSLYFWDNVTEKQKIKGDRNHVTETRTNPTEISTHAQLP